MISTFSWSALSYGMYMAGIDLPHRQIPTCYDENEIWALKESGWDTYQFDAPEEEEKTSKDLSFTPDKFVELAASSSPSPIIAQDANELNSLSTCPSSELAQNGLELLLPQKETRLDFPRVIATTSSVVSSPTMVDKKDNYRVDCSPSPTVEILKLSSTSSEDSPSDGDSMPSSVKAATIGLSRNGGFRKERVSDKPYSRKINTSNKKKRKSPSPSGEVIGKRCPECNYLQMPSTGENRSFIRHMETHVKYKKVLWQCRGTKSTPFFFVIIIPL